MERHPEKAVLTAEDDGGGEHHQSAKHHEYNREEGGESGQLVETDFSFHRFWQIAFVTKNAPKAQSATGTRKIRKPTIAIRAEKGCLFQPYAEA